MPQVLLKGEIFKVFLKLQPSPLFLQSAFFILPLGFIFELTGYCPWYIKNLILTSLLLIPCIWGKGSYRWIGTIGPATSLLVHFLYPSYPPHIVETTLWLSAWAWSWGWTYRVTVNLFNAVFLFFIIYIVFWLSAPGILVLEKLNYLLIAFLSWVATTPFNVGPSYSNIASITMFLLFSAFLSKGKSYNLVRFLCFALIVVVVELLLLLVLFYKVDFSRDFTWRFSFRETLGLKELLSHLKALIVLVYPGFLFICHLILFLVFHPPIELIDQSSHDRLYPKFSKNTLILNLTLFILAGLIILMFCPPTLLRTGQKRHFIFINKGMVSFTKPTYQHYGKAASGMYGMMPDYIRLFGCSAEITDSLPRVISTEDIIVFTNLDQALDPDEYQRLWQAIEAGAGLWVLGDHTFIKNGKNFINELLAPTHIRLNHDSAQFFPQGWFNSYRIAQGTVFSTLFDPAENKLGILVGASLKIRAPAFPLIIGRFGYGDIGTETPDPTRGYLGNFVYEQDERLGDLILVAGQLFGQGKILVFGDTSSFFNANLPRTYELLRAIIAYFGESNRWWFHTIAPWRHCLVGMVLGICIWLIWINFTNQKTIIAFALCLACFSIGGLGLYTNGGLPKWDSRFTQSRLVLIDFSHQPYASKHSAMGNGLHGLRLNLMRQGLLPIEVDQWSDWLILNSKIVIFIAPRRSFNAHEIDVLTKLMEKGGTVILSCGFPHRESSKGLLNKFGLDIEPVPLGRFFDSTAFGQRISTFSAWPINVKNPNTSLISIWGDWPIIVMVPIDKGFLVVVGDSEFFHNQNLEGLESYDPGNVNFMKNLLSYVMKGQTP